MIKGSNQQENITFANTYELNIGASEYIKPTLTDTNGETAVL